MTVGSASGELAGRWASVQDARFESVTVPRTVVGAVTSVPSAGDRSATTGGVVSAGSPTQTLSCAVAVS
jgi:hypothetical protein